MRPPKTKQRRGVQVLFRVRIAMMMPVVGRPPEHAFLRGAGGHHGDDELKRAAGLKSAVRKIAVVTRRDKEHAHIKERQADNQIRPAKTHEKYGNAGNMSGKK